MVPQPESETDAGVAQINECNSYCHTEGKYTTGDFIFPYNITSDSDIDSTGKGNADLSVSSDLTADGYGGSGASRDYKALGNAEHHVYFTATSDNPLTTEIKVIFRITASGDLRFTQNGDQALPVVSASLGVNANIERMGWTEMGEGDFFWEGEDLGIELEGHAEVGADSNGESYSDGIFEDEISSADVELTSVFGEGEIECIIIPDDEMMVLNLSLYTSSVVKFTSANPVDSQSAFAQCADGTASYSYEAFDPDRVDDPGTEITVNFFVPEF